MTFQRTHSLLAAPDSYQRDALCQGQEDSTQEQSRKKLSRKTLLIFTEISRVFLRDYHTMNLISVLWTSLQSLPVFWPITNESLHTSGGMSYSLGIISRSNTRRWASCVC